MIMSLNCTTAAENFVRGIKRQWEEEVSINVERVEREIKRVQKFVAFLKVTKTIRIGMVTW